MIRRGWSAEQAGEITIVSARWLIAEEPYHDAAWQMMEFGSRAIGGSGVIPERATVDVPKAAKVIPEMRRALERLGWRGPGE